MSNTSSTNSQAENPEDLIADLTSKIQILEIQLVMAATEKRHLLAQNVVKTHVVAGMAIGFLPLPAIDIFALSTLQGNLLRNLCTLYQVDFDEQTGKCIISSMLGGATPILAVLGLSSFAKIIPAIGTLGGSISMTLIVGAVVYATGQVLIRHFEHGGNLQNFNSKHWQAFFIEQVEHGKSLIKENKIKELH